ncbi:hypothetical protein [Alkalicoccobacillus plakortidis]|uniref:DUF4190 domain-containing protein n=1 Tax=Alkalicoccobacillus plakortidis TaxID=444060 RepID=A0ABT0XJP3_9BACI|nr:hypothetical protein [Alkalicoccobacillus plakortidis]MCM2676106.1 hypothetical protein [Alkalicoccobacillus plakortidis]
MTTQSTTNQQGTAVGALILAILGLFIPVLGIVTAIIGLVMIAKVTAPEQSGLKTATKVIAWISIVLQLVYTVLIVGGFLSYYMFVETVTVEEI